jgi:hypothetical protein
MNACRTCAPERLEGGERIARPSAANPPCGCSRCVAQRWWRCLPSACPPSPNPHQPPHQPPMRAVGTVLLPLCGTPAYQGVGHKGVVEKRAEPGLHAVLPCHEEVDQRLQERGLERGQVCLCVQNTHGHGHGRRRQLLARVVGNPVGLPPHSGSSRRRLNRPGFLCHARPSCRDEVAGIDAKAAVRAWVHCRRCGCKQYQESRSNVAWSGKVTICSVYALGEGGRGKDVTCVNVRPSRMVRGQRQGKPTSISRQNFCCC